MNEQATENILPETEVVPDPAQIEAERKQSLLASVRHLERPSAVKGVYMTGWAAGTGSFRKSILSLIDETELNSVIIDVQDYSGKISFPVMDPVLIETGAAEKRIPDIIEFINTLHDKNIYVIGRITVFQNPYFSKKNPELAVKKTSDKTQIWKDKKGLSYIDPGAKEYWDYIISLSNEGYRFGFDEINFDYIRFPSDGNMKDIYYPYSDGRIKAEALKEFFVYLHENLSGGGMKTSADLFGMTMTNPDDLGIGQILENAAPYFDYIAPMVYPSHWASGALGIDKPAKYPYEVVKISMQKGAERLKAIGEDPKKLVPWLQDFNLGAIYTADMVRKQIQATYDAGLDSWMLWDPKNTYTRDALLKEPGEQAMAIE